MTKPTKWPVHPAKTQISLGIRPVWLESLLSAWRKLGSLGTHEAHSEDWLDWVDAKAYLSLCWARKTNCWFCHASAHMIFLISELSAMIGGAHNGTDFIVKNYSEAEAETIFKEFFRWQCNREFETKVCSEYKQRNLLSETSPGIQLNFTALWNWSWHPAHLYRSVKLVPAYSSILLLHETGPGIQLNFTAPRNWSRHTAQFYCSTKLVPAYSSILLLHETGPGIQLNFTAPRNWSRHTAQFYCSTKLVPAYSSILLLHETGPGIQLNFTAPRNWSRHTAQFYCKNLKLWTSEKVL